MAGLTIKQEKFCQGLFTGLTQREAYKQSYNAENMTDKSIDEKSCVLANTVKVKERLAFLRDEFKGRNMVTVERVITEYKKIAFADIKDFVSFGTVKTEVGFDEETGEPIYGYKQIVEAKPSAEVDGTLINEVSIGKDGTFKFKLHDKKGALDMIGKHLGMFIDKTEVTGKNGGRIELDIDLEGMSDDDLLKTIERTSSIINSLQKRVSPKD